MNSNPRRIAAAILIALAAIIAAFLLIEQSRYVALLIYGVLFLLSCFFVVVLRGRLRDVSLVGASLALGLIGVELIVWRVGGAPMTYKDKGSWSQKGDLGWSPTRPGPIHEKKVAANGDVIYDVVNTIDEHLLRRTESATSGPTIAFFGDSMTFGAGVNDADTLPQSFADLTGRRLRVLNLAVTGYGPQQFLRALEIGAHDELLRDDPRLFVIFTSPWHASRTSCVADNAWFAPSYELKDGAPVFRGSCAEQAKGLSGALRGLFRTTEAFKFFLQRERPMEQADLDLYLAILIKAGELAREKYGVPTLILYLPDDLSNPRYRLGPGYGNDDLMRKLRDGGLKVVDAFIDFSAYPPNSLLIPGDGHPTGLAHRIFAGKVKAFVDAEMPGLRDKN